MSRLQLDNEKWIPRCSVATPQKHRAFAGKLSAVAADVAVADVAAVVAENVAASVAAASVAAVSDAAVAVSDVAVAAVVAASVADAAHEVTNLQELPPLATDPDGSEPTDHRGFDEIVPGTVPDASACQHPEQQTNLKIKVQPLTSKKANLKTESQSQPRDNNQSCDAKILKLTLMHRSLSAERSWDES